MRMDTYDPKAPIKSTNLSINRDLLSQAKQNNTNLIIGF